jgi:putative oxidoreductase
MHLVKADNPTPRLLSILRICVGLLFFQHGAEKLWGFAGARSAGIHLTLRGMAGPIEVIGGTLIVLGLFTRFTAFILCGEMAVAYFTWTRFGWWPINNGGEEAVIFCFLYLWLVAAGPGPWSLDSLIHNVRAGAGEKSGAVVTPIGTVKRNTSMIEKIGSWESDARSLLRIILAFTLSLHGFRHLFGAFPRLGGRLGAPVAIDVLPPVFGVLEIAGALLLILGLFTTAAAWVLCAELLGAYLYASVPLSIWPIRNGGNNVLLYFLVFMYLAVSGAGRWSWEDYRKRVKSSFAPQPATE